MKTKNIITASALSLASIALAAGFAFNAYAQGADTPTAATNTGTTISEKLGFRVGGRGNQTNPTVAQKAEIDQEREARRAAMQTAVNSGNYNTWVTAVKAQMGDKAPILSKVTADNFTQYAEAHKLMEQAREKLSAIGIDGGEGMGMGAGMGRGRGHGMGGHRQVESVNVAE